MRASLTGCGGLAATGRPAAAESAIAALEGSSATTASRLGAGGGNLPSDPSPRDRAAALAEFAGPSLRRKASVTRRASDRRVRGAGGGGGGGDACRGTIRTVGRAGLGAGADDSRLRRMTGRARARSPGSVGAVGLRSNPGAESAGGAGTDACGAGSGSWPAGLAAAPTELEVGGSVGLGIAAAPSSGSRSGGTGAGAPSAVGLAGRVASRLAGRLIGGEVSVGVVDPDVGPSRICEPRPGIRGAGGSSSVAAGVEGGGIGPL